MILQGDSEKIEYLCEILTKIDNILTQWTRQALMKKKMGVENLVGLSRQHVDITSVPDTHLTALYFIEIKKDIFSAFSM